MHVFIRLWPLDISRDKEAWRHDWIEEKMELRSQPVLELWILDDT